MAEAAVQVFGFGRPGFVIIVLVMLGVGSWLGELILGAVNKGQIGAMLKTVTTIVAILSMLTVAWQLLEKFFDFTSGKM
ncbi:MAG TPA: hypothetical protein DEF42_03575 [Desulfosporosinus sp.]|nr:hypothetical protein [Desulfosporosinus sp.]